MADIKTRDAVKGTIKTLDKAAVASERMKSAYAKTKEKAEEGYFSEESSPSEYAGNRLSSSAERVTKEGIHQFDKQGRKGVRETKENIIKAKDKIADFRQRRAEKAVSGKQAGAQVRYGTPSPSTAAQTGKAAQQANSTVKGTVRKANKTVKTAAKGTVKTTQKTVKTAQPDRCPGHSGANGCRETPWPGAVRRPVSTKVGSRFPQFMPPWPWPCTDGTAWSPPHRWRRWSGTPTWGNPPRPYRQYRYGARDGTP